MNFEEYLRYEPETGKIFWIKKTSSKSRKNVGDEAGSINTTGRYPVVRFLGKNYLFHRVCWYLYYGKWPEKQIDHINRDRFDNRISNLRDVSLRENNKNKENYSKGASYHKRDKYWYSQIQFNGKKIWLGKFSSKQDAQGAYSKAEKDFNL